MRLPAFDNKYVKIVKIILFSVVIVTHTNTTFAKNIKTEPNVKVTWQTHKQRAESVCHNTFIH